MRDAEAASPAAALYKSPLVKQDLARLDKDAEGRRSAMNSLKACVENLDPGSMPRFLAQVSEARDQGVSRSYAISLYEEVARVHGKLIIPHIPRVMAAVSKSLSSSGSSPHLHQACAKVVSAVAKFSVDGGSPAQASEILREVSDPLLGLLTIKPEPVAAGAAVCLQALVECDKWEHASEDLVNEVCLRAIVAVGEKTIRTVAHLQLAKSLAGLNPGAFTSYGVILLGSGSSILRQAPTSGNWQLRASAARLLQAVLPLVDRAALGSKLDHIIQILEDSKHDLMAPVRAAAGDALKTAKDIAALTPRDAFDGEGLSPDAPRLSSLDLDENQLNRSSSEMRSLFGSSDDVLTSGPNPENLLADFSDDSLLSFFPNSSPGSSISTQASLGNHRRSPPSQTSLVSREFSPRSSELVWADGAEAYLNPDRLCYLDAKENVPSRTLDVNAGASDDPSFSSGLSHCCDQHERPVGSTLPVGRGLDLSPPPFLGDDTPGTDQQSVDIEGRGGRNSNDPENSAITVHRIREGGHSSVDEEVLSNGTTVDIEVEMGSETEHHRRAFKPSNYSNEACNGSYDLVRHSSSRLSGNQTTLNGSARKNLFNAEEGADASPMQSVIASNDEGCLHRRSTGDREKPLDRSCDQSKPRHSPRPPLPGGKSNGSPQTAEQRPKALITADDFLPFSTPRRLVRSLQSNLSSPGASVTVKDADSNQRDEAGADMDLESCSEPSWSVRDNPMASDESFGTDSDEDQVEQEGKTQKKVIIDCGKGNRAGQMETGNFLAKDYKRISSALMHAAESLLCTTTGRTLGHECSSVDGDIMSSRSEDKEGSFCDSCTHCPANARSLTEKDVCFECSCGGQNFNRRRYHEGKELSPRPRGGRETYTIWTLDLERNRITRFFLMWLRHTSRHTLANVLRRVYECSKMFLGGFLVVVLALPFAMVTSKLLLAHAEHYGLVPT